VRKYAPLYMCVPARYEFANSLLEGVTVSREGVVFRDDVPLRATVRNGGLTVHVRSKMFRVSRMVLISFGQPPPSSHHCASHLNGNVADCRLENLEWVTRSILRARRALKKASGLPTGVRIKMTRKGPRYQAIFKCKSLGCFFTIGEAVFARECEILGNDEARANYLLAL